MDEEIMISFENVTKAILAERELLKKGFDVRVMFMPDVIQKGCGFCLRVLPNDIEKAVCILQSFEIKIIESWIKKIDGSYKKITIGKTNTLIR
ncbi:MAG: hypothetical protein Ta2B_04420 [Termitinemataceae bacterium]|nr:MAG: hypothetical protein Ta2B_04420 [Termitinemataceae bacterium]